MDVTKSYAAPEVYRTLYCELKQYPYYQEIFTDGCKSTNQVCAATVFLSSKLAFSTKSPHTVSHLCIRIGHYGTIQMLYYYYYYYYTTSIFTAELLAIQLALSNIYKTHNNFHILFSDS